MYRRQKRRRCVCVVMDIGLQEYTFEPRAWWVTQSALSCDTARSIAPNALATSTVQSAGSVFFFAAAITKNERQWMLWTKDGLIVDLFHRVKYPLQIPTAGPTAGQGPRPFKGRHAVPSPFFPSSPHPLNAATMCRSRLGLIHRHRSLTPPRFGATLREADQQIRHLEEPNCIGHVSTMGDTCTPSQRRSVTQVARNVAVT